MISLIQASLLLGTILLIFSLSVSTKSTRKSKVKSCQPFPYASLDHGRITVAGHQKYSFHCDSGYFLVSPKVVRCWRGKWSSTRQPKCIQSGGRCDDPPSVEGGTILGNARHVGSVVQYMCHEGYMLLGEGRRNCLQSGHWSGVTPTCMDETEPVQKVAERLKNKFVTEIGAYSNSSNSMGRLLDSDSLLHGLELVILLDRSSSVDPVDFKKGVDFVKFLLHQFGVKNGNNTSGTRAAVLAFGTEVDILFNLDNETITNAAAASKALDTLQAGGGGTALEEALMSVYTRLPQLRARAKRALFVLTDGEPNIGTAEDALFFARSLRGDENFKFEIFTLGIGRGINRQFLAQMASEPAYNHVFVLDKYSNLMTVIQTIKDKNPKNKPISPARCGFVPSVRDHLKSWPWLSAIYIGLPDPRNEARLGLCSGTLICSQWVLTAAACFYHSPTSTGAVDAEPQLITSEVFPVLGEEDLVNDDQNQMNFYSEKVVIHPDFDPTNDLSHNLALVKLNTAAPMGRFRPACLPPTDRTILLHQNLNTNASIAGWGLPSSRGGDREISGDTEHLRVANATVVLEDESECRRHSRPHTHDIFCAGRGHGKQTCIGDLGSPIIAVDPSTNLHHVIGVLSSKSRCFKGINQYTEITKYISWIDDVTEKCQLKHYMV